MTFTILLGGEPGWEDVERRVGMRRVVMKYVPVGWISALRKEGGGEGETYRER